MNLEKIVISIEGKELAQIVIPTEDRTIGSIYYPRGEFTFKKQFSFRAKGLLDFLFENERFATIVKKDSLAHEYAVVLETSQPITTMESYMHGECTIGSYDRKDFSDNADKDNLVLCRTRDTYPSVRDCVGKAAIAGHEFSFTYILKDKSEYPAEFNRVYLLKDEKKKVCTPAIKDLEELDAGLGSLQPIKAPDASAPISEKVPAEPLARKDNSPTSLLEKKDQLLWFDSSDRVVNALREVINFNQLLVGEDNQDKLFYSLSGIEGNPHKYIESYIDNPAQIIKKELEHLTKVSINEKDRLARASVALHGQIHQALFQQNAKLEVDAHKFREATNIDFLVDGDYLPGSSFVMGQEHTYNRELLQVSRNNALVFDTLVNMKLLSLRNLSNGSTLETTAKSIFIEFQKKYSDEQDGIITPGVAKTFGGFMENGGCCRHRAGVLQTVYQEAGIRSRYIRGNLPRTGPHAWVFVYADESDRPAFVADTNLNHAKKGNFAFEHEIPRGEFSKIDSIHDFGAGKKLAGMHIYDPNEYNTIWRAKL